MGMNDLEQKGIFVWEQEPSKALFIGSLDEPLITYKFPLTVIGTGVEDEAGTACFYSQKTRNALMDQVRKDISCSELDIGELVVRHYIFKAENDDDIGFRESLHIWLKCNLEDKEVFLYDDLFMENQTGYNANGDETTFCAIPFSEECPLDHTREDGNFDVADINTWPIYLISEEVE